MIKVMFECLGNLKEKKEFRSKLNDCKEIKYYIKNMVKKLLLN